MLSVGHGIVLGLSESDLWMYLFIKEIVLPFMFCSVKMVS